MDGMIVICDAHLPDGKRNSIRSVQDLWQNRRREKKRSVTQLIAAVIYGTNGLRNGPLLDLAWVHNSTPIPPQSLRLFLVKVPEAPVATNRDLQHHKQQQPGGHGVTDA